MPFDMARRHGAQGIGFRAVSVVASKRQREWNFRVNLVILTMRRSLPVCPGKQTGSEPVGISHSCRASTFDGLFDNLVGMSALIQRQRDRSSGRGSILA
jgi:hypothetical protein